MTEKIVGIRFQKVGKVYHFDATQFSDIIVGDHVIVDTSRGQQLGEVVQILTDTQINGKQDEIKPVLRAATPRDLVLRQMWEEKETEVIDYCRQQLGELKLPGVKIIAAEFTLNGDRLTVLHTLDENDKLDMTPLRKAVQEKYRTKVNLRKIGPRDAAKIIGGLGACGLETRCCTLHMTEFIPISIKMAKVQNVSLAPSEITGMCGRLRCCLQHEYDFYDEARKRMPKLKRVVVTPLGEGKVIQVNPLADTVKVDLGEQGWKEFPTDEVKPRGQ